jgi:signal transduction histidine kinase
MIRLKTKLSLFNLLSKLIFAAIFIAVMPLIIERINLRYVDNNLIQKREEVISLISEIGIEPFIAEDSSSAFGSYNILKEEFISLEKYDSEEDLNYIEVSRRLIEGEEIDYRVLNYSFLVDGRKYRLEVGKSLSSIKQTAENTRKVMILFLVFIVIVTFITDQQYTRAALIPLDRIIKKLREISDPSNFDKVPVKTTTEDFTRLDTALREMMSHIDQLFQKEKEITVNISHELMTPISVLRSKLENLLLRADITPEVAEKTEESLKTLHRLQTLVSSLLFIARIESHQYLRNEEFSISDVLKEITGELRPFAEDKNIRIEENIIYESNTIKQANRSLVFSMFYNVINNAIKNTGSPGTITIKSFSEKSKIYVEISDTGIGLDEEQMKNLFARFRNRNEKSGDGTGIGLAITKTIADFHNIKVEVSSKPGAGTKFLFIITVIS